MPNQAAAQFVDSKDDIDISDIARFVQQNWRKIAYFSSAGVLVALFIVLTAKPNFAVNGSLYFGDSQSQNLSSSNNTNLITNFQSVNDVPTEVVLIQSRSLVERAILETGLNATAEPVGTTAINYWQWRFRDHQAIDAYAPKANHLSVLYATVLDPGNAGETYELKFGRNGNYQLFNSEGEGSPILNGQLNQPAAGRGVTLLIKLTNNEPMTVDGSKYNITIKPAKSLAELLIGGKLSVVQGGLSTNPTQTANINFLWSNPYDGAIFLNQLMMDFIATQLSWKTESASDSQKFISEQLENIKLSLADADQKLASYEAETGIVDVPANAQSVISQLSQYEVQRATAMLEAQALQQLVASTSQSQSRFNPYLVTQTGDPVLAQLAGNLATAEIQLKTQSLQFTGSSPELQSQEETVLQTKQAIQTLLRNDERLAEAKVKNLDNLIDKYKSQLKSLPAQSLQIAELNRASDVFGRLYVMLMQNEEEADVSKAATIVNTRIVSPAEVPLSATSPKGTITVLTGLILGLLIGTMFVLMQRVLSGRFHSEGDVQRSNYLPVYGLISNRPRTSLSDKIVPLHLRPYGFEDFRIMRSGIYQLFSGETSKARVILITSGADGDGKTTLAINLAKSISDDGGRVLLIDGDLYKGSLHEILHMRQFPGFSDILSGHENSSPQAIPGQNFSAISVGTYISNPANFLKVGALKNLIQTLSGDYDYIIIDCPPLPSVVDTLIYAKIADLVLSVIRLEKTTRSSFKAHNDTLNNLSVKRGIIINGLSAGPHYRGRSYGYTVEKDSPWSRLITRRFYQN